MQETLHRIYGSGKKFTYQASHLLRRNPCNGYIKPWVDNHSPKGNKKGTLNPRTYNKTLGINRHIVREWWRGVQSPKRNANLASMMLPWNHSQKAIRSLGRHRIFGAKNWRRRNLWKNCELLTKKRIELSSNENQPMGDITWNTGWFIGILPMVTYVLSSTWDKSLDFLCLFMFSRDSHLRKVQSPTIQQVSIMVYKSLL